MDTTPQPLDPIDILVLVPLPDEMSAFLALLGQPAQRGGGDYSWYVWTNIQLKDRADGVLVAVIPYDMDQLPAADAMQRALKRWAPKYAALVGIGGLIDKKSHLGDVLVARYVQQIDAKRKETEEGTATSLVPIPISKDGPVAAQSLRADNIVYQKWQQECLDWLKFKLRPELKSSPKNWLSKTITGAVIEIKNFLGIRKPRSVYPSIDQAPALHIENAATGSAVIDSKSHREAISRLDRKLHMVETEAAGFVMGVQSSNEEIITIIIRGASDAASNKGTSDAQGGGVWREYAAGNAFRLLLYLLRHELDGAPRPGGPERLARSAEIRLSSGSIRINRDVANAASRWASEGSFVIVGEPGAGKSAVMHATALNLKRNGREVAVLTADDLLREPQTLNLLKARKSTQSLFLLIDGLDTVRGERYTELLEVIANCQAIDQWRIIASVRRFDLEASPRLQSLFRGQPHSEHACYRNELAKIRHLEVGPLNDQEIAQVYTQSPSLGDFFNKASPALQKILRNPFNLDLAGQLLDLHCDTNRISMITTQVELLDMYWNYRVTEHSDEQVQDLLQAICERMMSIPAMVLSRDALRSVSGTAALNILQREGILVSFNRNHIEFAHPILFDFAIATIWLKDEHLVSHDDKSLQRFQPFVDQIVQRTNLIFLIYPSLHMYFVRLWSRANDRASFWDCVLQLALKDASPTMQVPAMVVAAQATEAFDDLGPLYLMLQTPEARKRDVAGKVLQRLVSAVISLHSPESTQHWEKTSPWCRLASDAARLTEAMPRDAARRLLTRLVSIESLSAEEVADAGRAARALFEWTWNSLPQSAWMLGDVTGFVCRTTSSASDESVELLQRVIEPGHLESFGYETLPALAKSLRWVLPYAPAFVAKSYCRAFEYQEGSREHIHRGGPVMAFAWERRQDYERGLSQLKEQFGVFLKLYPSEATCVLISILTAFHTRRGAKGLAATAPSLITFIIADKEAKLQHDYSAIWDRESRHPDDEIQILKTWTHWLDELVGDASKEALVKSILDIVIRDNQLEAIWMRLLRIAARHPERLGRMFLPLILHHNVLTLYKRDEDIGVFLLQLRPLLSPREREKIGDELRALPDRVEPERRQYGEHVRDKLLSILVSPAATPISESHPPLPAQDEEDEIQMLPASLPVASPAGEDEALNACLLPVDRWLSDQQRDIAPESYRGTTRTALKALHTALNGEPGHRANGNLKDRAWGVLATVAKMAAETQAIAAQDELRGELRQYLLDASKQKVPRPGRDEPIPARETVSWPSLEARLEASIGLCSLAWWSPMPDEEVLSALEHLATSDDCSMVRYQVISRLDALKKHDATRLARIGRHLVEEEASGAVVLEFLRRGLRFFANDVNLAREMLDRILARFSSAEPEKDNEDTIGRLALHWYVDWSVYNELPAAQERLEQVIGEPWRLEAKWLTDFVYKELSLGLTDAAIDPSKIRSRAWALLNELTTSAALHFHRLAAVIPPGDSPEGKQFLGVQHTLNAIARLLWHKTEAYEVEKKRRGEAHSLGSPFIRRAIFEQAQPILATLANIGIPVIADELLKTLGGVIEFSAKETILLASNSLCAAAMRGFATDNFALHDTLEFINICMSEQQDLLRRDAEASQAIVRILDLFVDMGWPAAHKLVFQLHEAFR